MFARTAALAVLGLLLAGCVVVPTTRDEISFKYTARSGEGNMDQLLEIENEGVAAVVPTLEITPLDWLGHPVPDVTVTSAFGSERGTRVVPAYFTDIDVLKFEGPAQRRRPDCGRGADRVGAAAATGRSSSSGRSRWTTSSPCPPGGARWCGCPRSSPTA